MTLPKKVSKERQDRIDRVMGMRHYESASVKEIARSEDIDPKLVYADLAIGKRDQTKKLGAQVAELMADGRLRTAEDICHRINNITDGRGNVIDKKDLVNEKDVKHIMASLLARDSVVLADNKSGIYRAAAAQ